MEIGLSRIPAAFAPSPTAPPRTHHLPLSPRRARCSHHTLSPPRPPSPPHRRALSGAPRPRGALGFQGGGKPCPPRGGPFLWGSRAPRSALGSPRSLQRGAVAQREGGWGGWGPSPGSSRAPRPLVLPPPERPAQPGRAGGLGAGAAGGGRSRPTATGGRGGPGGAGRDSMAAPAPGSAAAPAASGPRPAALFPGAGSGPGSARPPAAGAGRGVGVGPPGARETCPGAAGGTRGHGGEIKGPGAAALLAPGRVRRSCFASLHVSLPHSLLPSFLRAQRRAHGPQPPSPRALRSRRGSAR